MNQRKIGTLLSYLHILIANTISILYTPYMLQLMGQSEYGLYGTANSFISYLSILCVGIGGSYIRFNSRYRAAGDREGEKQLNGMFLIVFSFLAVLVCIGGVGCTILAERLVEETFTAVELYKLRIILLLLTVNMMCTFLMNVVMMALQAYEKYIALRAASLVTAIITPVVNIIALRAGGRSVTITAISLTISILCYIFYFFYAKSAIKMEFSFRNLRWSVIKEIFVFSGFLFLNSITDQITYSTDNIILGAVSGTAAVAVYTVGSQFRHYFQQFSTSISAVFAPSVNLMVANQKKMSELDSLFTRVGRIQFYVVSLILIGYASIGQDFIRLWAGPDYADAYWIGLLLMLSVFIPSFQNVGLEIQKAFNKHKARSIAYFLIALLNILLTIPCTHRWGPIGAAAATLATTFWGYVVFMNYYYWKHIGLDIPGFWKSIAGILPGFVPPLAVGLGISCLLNLDSFLDVLLAAAAISAVYLASVWGFSMNPYEKDLLRKFRRNRTHQ